MLNQLFSAFRDRKHRRETINEIVGIFQNVESFMEIFERRGHRHYTRFCKVKIIRSTMRSNGGAVSLFIFMLYDCVPQNAHNIQIICCLGWNNFTL